MGNKIDLWIDRLAGGDNKITDEDLSLELICTRLINSAHCAEKPYLLLITGSIADEKILLLFEVLRQRLDPEAFVCDWSGFIEKNFVTIQKAKQSNGIVLVETLRQTKAPCLEEEIRIFRDDLKKPILGCVLVQ